MAEKNLVPKLTAAQILRTLEDNLVAKKICNLTAAGEIKNKGDSITFPGLADPTISTYTGSVDYEKLQDSGVTLYVDQADYFAFEVDDIEKYQATIDAKSSQATRAAYGLQHKADKFILSKYADAGLKAATGDVTVTESNVLSTLAQFEKKLMEHNAQNEKLWMVMPPFVKVFLQLAGVKFQINNGINGTGGLAWTEDLGYELYISNCLTIKSGKVQVLAGTKNAIVFADQITDTETLRLESKFADAVRGLHVYGAKVIKPLELVTASFIEGQPSGI